MRDLLFLTHRIPYPPNKGDKIRAFHILRYLARHFRVHLGSFIDDKADLAHARSLSEWCYRQHLVPLRPWLQQIKSSSALWRGIPLSLAYYRHRSLQLWVTQTLTAYRVPLALAYSGAMAPYLPARTPHGPLERILDLVDVDSEKWRQYASESAPPASWLYRREAQLLGAFELSMARQLDKVMLVSPAEAELLRRAAPELGHKIDYFSNGVDTDYFRPDATLPNPFRAQPTLVFTGAMDYRPNIDAALWFAAQILPALLGRFPGLQLHLVGARPDQRLRQLALTGPVHVSGTVADIRPYLQHASLVVAPLRIARGIQNKVLEAMAMAKTVVATPQALEGIQLHTGSEALQASDASEFIAIISHQLERHNSSALRARQRMLSDYQWEHNLARLGQVLHLPQRRRANGEAL